MGDYNAIRKKASKKYKSRPAYAAGGRVAATKNGGKTTINIITAPAPQAAPPAMPPAPPVPPPPAPGGSPAMSAAGSQAMQALGAGAPPAFKRGGRVKGGAAGGLGRLEHAAAQKRKGKRGGGKVC